MMFLFCIATNTNFKCTELQQVCRPPFLYMVLSIDNPSLLQQTNSSKIIRLALCSRVAYLPVNFLNLLLKVPHSCFSAVIFNKGKEGSICNFNLYMFLDGPLKLKLTIKCTHKEIFFLEARQLAVKFANRMEVTKEVVHVVQRVDHLVEVAHHLGGVFS